MYVRAALRILALALTAWGLLSEDQAEVLYTNPDIVGLASLALAEVYFYTDKLIQRMRRNV